MTTIKVHGILGKHFGSEFFMDIGRTSQTLEAIDSNRPGFIKKINELSRKGFYYSIVVDGKKINNVQSFMKSKKPKKVDLVPVIAGSGFAAIGAAFVAIKAWAVANVALAQFALFIISTAVQMLLAPKPAAFPDVKATEASTRGLERSFSFSNKSNLASQGTPVPVGYGRLRVGSQVIQACIKTFPQNVQAADAMIANPYYTQIGVSQSDSNNT